MPSRPISEEPKPSLSLSSMQRSTTNKAVFLVITLSATALILFTVIYIIYHLWHTLLHHYRTNPFDSAAPLGLQRFTYRELMSATNGFSPDNTIGKGATGSVFRGILRDGKSVAIKKLQVSSLQVDKEFQNELAILGGIQSPYIVDLLGYCVEKNQRLLVYGYMPNRSLQELLFADWNNECLSWDRRFQIIRDVAKAIEFLHHECDPPVIHGDLKPGNVLLDWDFRAKVSDFGLSRHKAELDQFGAENFSQDLGKTPELLSGNLLSGTLRNEADFTQTVQASSCSKSSRVFRGFNGTEPLNLEVKTNDGGCIPKKNEVVLSLQDHDHDERFKKSYICDEELTSIEHSKELEFSHSPITIDETGYPQQWGKEWWWRQEGSGELCSKDYVSEWIGSQISQPAANLDWEEEEIMRMSSPYSEKMKDTDSFPRQAPQPGCALDEGLEQRYGTPRNRRSRKIQEWWKDEHLDEMNRKGSRRKSLNSRIKKRRCFNKFVIFPHVKLGHRLYILKQRKKLWKQRCTNTANPDAELSFRRTWKGNKSLSMGSEMWSGDLFSRELSSTTSMRGTLCYMAPEHGGCGYLMEKVDVYSLGVLLLVIISGRRPLHIMNSPMKLDRANLISWSRQLAQAGSVLELVDERMKGAYNKEQVTLCINVALACLQRMPELRPDIVDVVKILQGEKDLPLLPYELSPSPPSKLFSRTRRKCKSNSKS